MSELTFVDRYLRLGLSFDRLEPGFVDAYFGDRQLRRDVMSAPAPEPTKLRAEARALRRALAGERLDPTRSEFLDGHLRAMECSAAKFAGESITYVEEVRAYFDVDIDMHDEAAYEQAHAQLNEALPGPGSLASRMQAYRSANIVPPERLSDVINAFASALRDVVRDRWPLPDGEQIEFVVESDKPWSGFNYYLGRYQSKVAVNSDVSMYLDGVPGLIAHEAYPGHHTEHCRKEQRLPEAEQSIFVVNTPQCLMAEGLADHALSVAIGSQWGVWAQDIYADLGIRFDGALAQRVATAKAGLLHVRQDAALLLHDRGADVEDVQMFLQRWGLTPASQSKQTLRFLSSPLWRAYISTYVEGYALLGEWLDGPGEFARLLDEPLTPSALRRELAA